MRAAHRLAGAALALALGTPGCAGFHWSKPSEDRWWAEDKAKHFTLSAVGAAGVSGSFRVTGSDQTPALAAGFTSALAAGLLKEAWDANVETGSGWSWKDLAFDTAGSGLGAWAGSSVPRR